MTNERLCHKTLESDFNEEDELETVGSPCIRERCMAWSPDTNMVYGGYCKDLHK